MNDYLKDEGILDIVPNLSPDEKSVLQKPPLEVTFKDHQLIESILIKLVPTKNKKAIAFCRLRHASAYENSRLPPREKAFHWNLAANALSEAELPYSPILSMAASYYAKDGEYIEAAKLYEKSANKGAEEGLPDGEILVCFRESRKLHELSGNSDLAGKLFFFESDYKYKTSDGVKKIWLFIFKYLCGYGESPARVVLIAAIVILGCAFLYTLGGIYSARQNQLINSLPTSIYFSFVTFSTLGYGDYSPAGSFTRFLAAFEAISGIFLTSLFLITIVRKFSRF